MAQQPPTTAHSHPFTCLACSLAFTTAQAQRTHYSTDLHRYNAKRRLVGLDPLQPSAFDSKLLNHQSAPSIPDHPLSAPWKCEPCKKSFASEGAQASHLASRRHKLVIQQSQSLEHKLEHLKLCTQKSKTENLVGPPEVEIDQEKIDSKTKHADDMDLDCEEGSNIKDLEGGRLEKLIASRLKCAPVIGPTDCLFCPGPPRSFPDLDSALSHMLTQHGFFLPDRDYLANRTGLIAAFADRIRVWNVCLWCSAGFGGSIGEDGDGVGRQEKLARTGLDRVRKHMLDKAHCKIAWDTEKERLEYSEFFDYRSSHANPKAAEGDEWEDVSDVASEMDLDSDDLPVLPSFGYSPFQLVLPNGTRLGHRALRQIYKQNLLPYPLESETAKRIGAQNRLVIMNRKALVPGGGAGEMVRARNPGEAREAGRHIREFRDAKRREAFKTRVGCRSDRDPLLQ